VSLASQYARQAAAAGFAQEEYAYQPFIGKILAVDAENEQIRVDMGPLGINPMSMPQLFVSDDSWIRAIPKLGGVLLQQAADLAEPAAIRYYATNPSTRAREYAAAARELRQDPTKKDVTGISNFRAIRAGEIHIASAGVAEAYFSDRGTLELRGGPVTRALLGPDLETLDRAPLHRRQGLLHRQGQIKDEERLGNVKRADPDAPAFREKPILIDNTGGFTPPPTGGVLGAVGGLLSGPKSAAKEWLLNLACDGGEQPELLYDHRIGHVYDDEGEEVLDEETGKKLRAWIRYGAGIAGNVLEVLIDEIGNFAVLLPEEATSGGRLVIPTGGLEVEITAGDFTQRVGRNLDQAVGGRWTGRAELGVDLSTPKDAKLVGGTTAEVSAPRVGIGLAPESATPIQGVLTGETIDPLTGLPFSAFGQGSTAVFAKR